MLRIVPFLFVSLVIAACGEPQPVAVHENAEIAALSDRWEQALNAGDVDTLVTLYADDARVLAPNAEMAVGKNAVRAAFGEMVAAGLRGDLTVVDASSAGDLGYNVGTFVLQTADGSLVDRGKFVEIWQRIDGEWRITNDIWNSDGSAAGPVAQSDTALIATHNVADAATWLNAWQREDSRRNDFLRHGVTEVRVFQHRDNPNLTGLLIELEDLVAFEAFLQSEEGAAAAAADTVKMDTLTILQEVR